MEKNDEWVLLIEQKIKDFAEKHSTTYNKKGRELSASFEIGCFHALLNFYEARGFALKIENPIDGEYRYLTTPNGNPSNFSYISAIGIDGCFEIRQQVRIKSHLNNDIAFAPDMVVLFKESIISKTTDSDYASGKRPFYSVSSKDVVAAHECKSMTPFPELLVSFIGLFITAHEWYEQSEENISPLNNNGVHLAPTMFVGGTASALHLRMIKALESVYPINIVVGLHQGTWNLYADNRKLNKLKFSKNTYATVNQDTYLVQHIDLHLDDIPF
ncbi:hypothetical protein [Aeromonas caviae]|uniref:hypothetical protein n=1 Tax=Aeromonas caviae TaxID=648 RepID=UPI002B4A73C4|nr:hypothetical protein [Aeromonas caviae]